MKFLFNLQNSIDNLQKYKWPTFIWHTTIRAYRDKNGVEEAFKGVKTFIKFEPIYVRTDQHVKAHYTICVLSYLLDLTITQKIREHEIDEINSVRKVYQKLKRCLVGEIKLGSAKHTIKKMITIRPIEKKILNMFGGEYLCEKSYLQKIGIDYVKVK